jgi:hypothetical protein
VRCRLLRPSLTGAERQQRRSEEEQCEGSHGDSFRGSDS